MRTGIIVINLFKLQGAAVMQLVMRPLWLLLLKKVWVWKGCVETYWEYGQGLESPTGANSFPWRSLHGNELANVRESRNGDAMRPVAEKDRWPSSTKRSYMNDSTSK